MDCQRCKSQRILRINAKCDDRCFHEFNGKERSDYVDSHLGIGGGDYIEIDVCLECGQIQGDFPVEDPEWG